MPASRDETVPGADAVAGTILLRATLARPDIDERTKAVLRQQLLGVLPGQVVAPGGTVDQRIATPNDLGPLVVAAAVEAAGLDPAKTPSPPPPALWTDAGNQLLVRLGGIRATLDRGVIEFAIPVSCDQTDDTTVMVTFVTGAPGRPTGGVTTTEDHPRGDPRVVEVWHEQLIAFAWRTLVIATAALTGATGADRSGRTLIANALSADPKALSVLPMARHTYVRGTTR